MAINRLVSLSAILMMASGPVLAQQTTVNYGMTIAGLPIGSATMTMTPNGSSTSVAVVGKAGGPIDLGRLAASAVVTAGQVSVQSQSGSGKDATSAQLTSRGTPGNSNFNYTGTTSRGPGQITMTMAGNRVTALDAQIPDNPRAVRVPVTEAHKTNVMDPLSLLGLVFEPGGTLRPENVCGKTHAIFTGQSRFTMSATALEKRGPVSGLPEGFQAVSCRVTVTPVSGHRTDKGNAAQTRTANVVFASSAADRRTVLWSLSVPITFGSFTLTANSLK